MSIKTLFSLALVFLAIPTWAQSTQTWNGRAKINFDGTSTLHEWGGSVNCEPFKTTVVVDDAGKPQRVKATVSLQAAKMDTANAKRDEKMRVAMQVENHPTISAQIDAPAEAIAADLKTPAKLPLNLDLLGRQQQIEASITNWKYNGTKASFDLEFPISMKASGINVPSVLYLIRVGDTVKVRASVTLTKG